MTIVARIQSCSVLNGRQHSKSRAVLNGRRFEWPHRAALSSSIKCHSQGACRGHRGLKKPARKWPENQNGFMCSPEKNPGRVYVIAGAWLDLCTNVSSANLALALAGLRQRLELELEQSNDSTSPVMSLLLELEQSNVNLSQLSRTLVRPEARAMVGSLRQ